MIAAYLYLNALLYLVFAGWMTWSPWTTSAAVGYEVLNNSGRSEFLVIYGGLQLGLAVFFGISAGNVTLHRPALLFALCLYAPIVLYRIITVVKFSPVKGLTLGVAGLEITLLIAAVLLFVFRDRLSS